MSRKNESTKGKNLFSQFSPQESFILKTLIELPPPALPTPCPSYHNFSQSKPKTTNYIFSTSLVYSTLSFSSSNEALAYVHTQNIKLHYKKVYAKGVNSESTEVFCKAEST